FGAPTRGASSNRLPNTLIKKRPVTMGGDGLESPQPHVVVEGIEVHQLSERIGQLVRSAGECRPAERKAALAQAGRLQRSFRLGAFGAAPRSRATGSKSDTASRAT